MFIRQVENYTDNTKRTELAQLIIDAASSNILRNLRYYQERGKDLEEIIEQIKALKKGIFRTQNVEELMGVEGTIRKVYYDSWNIIVNQEIDFEKRVKRPPDNMINTMISFLNTLVYTACLSEIYVSQLNPTISYLHSVGDRRFSLSLDLAEVFKPLLADRVIFSLLNKKMITEKDFAKDSNYFYMKEKAQKLILKTFNERLETTIKHRDLGRNVSYRRLMRLEAYKIVKHLMEDKKYEGFKIWW